MTTETRPVEPSHNTTTNAKKERERLMSETTGRSGKPKEGTDQCNRRTRVAPGRGTTSWTGVDLKSDLNGRRS